MTLRFITIPGTEAGLAVHCTDAESGRIGCFLFVGSSWRVPGVRCSIMADSLADLFDWMEINGWQFNAVHSNYIKL